VPFSGDSTKRGTTSITVTVTGGTDSASQGILVQYLVDSAPPSANPKFPAVYFVDEQGKPSATDTTSASGVATRLLSASAAQFSQGALAAGRTDTVVVTVLVSYAGALVTGGPITFHVPITLQSLASPALVPLRRPTTGDILDPLGSKRGNRWARAVVPEIQRPAR
jgi:Flp pilus assembly protein TadG